MGLREKARWLGIDLFTYQDRIRREPAWDRWVTVAMNAELEADEHRHRPIAARSGSPERTDTQPDDR